MNLKSLFNPLQKRGVFDKISGHEDVKWLLTKSLKADKPVHVLLQGLPGLGKTAFLKAIETEYRDKSLFVSANGALTTGAGLADELFSKQPRYLLLDELEYFSKKDQAMLFELMQSGRLIETKVKTGRREIQLNCQIFATCNNTKKLSAPLMSRFMSKTIEPYTQEQFINIAIEQLDTDATLADFIACSVWNKYRDKSNMRECERIAAMCHSEEDVLEYMRLI